MDSLPIEKYECNAAFKEVVFKAARIMRMGLLETAGIRFHGMGIRIVGKI